VRRSWFIAAIVIGIVSIVVAALVMRLTEDDNGQSSATTWADSVCTSLTTWRASITAVADVGGDTLTPESLQQSLADAATATETLVDDLRALGPPDLDSGDDLKQQLDSAAAEIESSFDTLRQGAEAAAEADSPADFIAALTSLGPQFQALLDTISTTVDDLENANVSADAKAELQQAFESSSSCQQLRADS
jgi:exonuclease VII small subunit